jgi:hypothetical protein
MQDAAEVIMAVSFFGTVAITVRSIANAWGKRHDVRGHGEAFGAVEARLERIETAVDAIAVEVERIAEAQRFMARLSSERDTQRLPSGPPGAGGGRSITPH